jgi:hypothetical protein
MTVYTTVGYGNYACATRAGKWATIVYAMFGVPLCLVVLAKVGLGCEYVFQTIYKAIKRSFLGIFI